MKRILKAVLSVSMILVVASVFAGGPHAVEGVVNKVKMKEKRINISHGPIKSMGMDGMTMDFKVMDPSMLDDVKVGHNVSFEIETDKSGSFVIVDIEDKGKASGSSMSMHSDDGHGHSH